ncbi:hypothetical protein ABZ923_36815 [Streptomyces sp. NPDC046881]|uniref:hypothetical protein n=1 Tax=Streptomyces sp. NPDC046881 TaxID=3155374 RepID=UPI0033D0CCE2
MSTASQRTIPVRTAASATRRGPGPRAIRGRSRGRRSDEGHELPKPKKVAAQEQPAKKTAAKQTTAQKTAGRRPRSA